MVKKRDITRRRLLEGAAKTTAVFGAGALAGKLAVPAVWAQSKPDTLAVGAWGGLFGEVIHGAFGDSFEKEYGVTINYVRGGDSAKLTQLRTERGHQTLDVVFWTPTSASLMARELDAVVPLSDKADLMPRIQDLALGSRDPKIWTDYTVPPWAMGMTLVYRTDKIDTATANSIDTWRVVFDERFKGRIGWPNINWGPGWGLTMLAMMENTGTIESGKPRDVEAGWQLLPELIPQVIKFWDNDGEAEQLMQSGDTWISVRSTFEVSQWKKKQVPIDAFTALEEGMIATNEALSIIRSGDQGREDLAAQYINHCLTPASQMRLAEHLMTPISPKVELPPELASLLLTVEDVETMKHFDWIWMGTQIDPWTERWNKALAA